MDMRVYNGCPSDELREHLEYVGEMEARLKDKFPDAHLTYFPVEQMWVAHIWGTALTGFCSTKLDAILEALGE